MRSFKRAPRRYGRSRLGRRRNGVLGSYVLLHRVASSVLQNEVVYEFPGGPVFQLFLGYARLKHDSSVISPTCTPEICTRTLFRKSNIFLSSVSTLNPLSGSQPMWETCRNSEGCPMSALVRLRLRLARCTAKTYNRGVIAVAIFNSLFYRDPKCGSV